MKIGEFEVPENLLYTVEHEWVEIVSESRLLVGITDYAAKTLNDVVYVDLPSLGTEIVRTKTFGTVESIKAVSDLFAPVTGAVLRVNDELKTKPELVNESPYDTGWIIEVRPSNLRDDRGELLEAGAYTTHLKSIVEKKP